MAAKKATKATRAGVAPEQALSAIASKYPGAEEGIACKGTVLECITFKAGSKTFLFVGVAEAKVKLRESLAEAARLESKDPSGYKVGSAGWVTVSYGASEAPLDLLARWIDESYRLNASKKLLAQLPARPSSGA